MRCQPGDLAIVLRSFCYPEVVGRMVEVISLAPTDTEYTLPCGRKAFPGEPGDWIVRLANPVAGIQWGTCNDIHLLPIRPEPDEVTEETRELDTVE